jgi:hypothetical protein
MQLGLGGVCYIVAVVLFVIASGVPHDWPHSGRLSTLALAFFAAGHLL